MNQFNNNNSNLQQSTTIMMIMTILTFLTFFFVIANGQDMGDQLNQRKKCTQYGHSCLGGHGKRNSIQLPSTSFYSTKQQLSPESSLMQQKNSIKSLSLPLYIYRNQQINDIDNDDGRYEQAQAQAARLIAFLTNQDTTDQRQQQQQLAIDGPITSLLLERLRSSSHGFNNLRN